MNIIHLKTEDLTTSIARGGGYEYRLPAELGSEHMIWEKTGFVRGICTETPQIAIPILPVIPSLITIAVYIEKTGIQPTLYMSQNFGMGVAFLNIPKE